MENLFSTLTPFRLVGRGDPPLRSKWRLTRERGLNTDRVRQFGGTFPLQLIFLLFDSFHQWQDRPSSLTRGKKDVG